MNQDRIFRMYRRILNAIQEEMPCFLNDQLAELMKTMGLDFAQLQSMIGQKAGFDPYVVLGLDRKASDEEIKKRYRDLLHKLHPDTGGVEGTAFLLQMVLTSYEMIKRERRLQ